MNTLQELFKIISEFLSAVKTYLENLSTIDVVKDKKKLKKASNLTEELINEIREKGKQFDEVFDYSLMVIKEFLSEKEYKNFEKKVKEARNSRKILKLIRKIEKLD